MGVAIAILVCIVSVASSASALIVSIVSVRELLAATLLLVL